MNIKITIKPVGATTGRPISEKFNLFEEEEHLTSRKFSLNMQLCANLRVNFALQNFSED